MDTMGVKCVTGCRVLFAVLTRPCSERFLSPGSTLVPRFLPQDSGFKHRCPCGLGSSDRRLRAVAIVPRDWAAGRGLAGQNSPLVSPSAPHPSHGEPYGAPWRISPEEPSQPQSFPRTAAEDTPDGFRRIPNISRLRREPKGLPTLGLPSYSEKARSFPSGRPAGLLEAATAPCWMLCSLSEENPPASSEPRYREGRRFPRGGGQRPPAAGP